MTGAQTHPHGLRLPRDEDGLATSTAATRRMRRLLPAVLEEMVADADAEGVVLGLDGGVDTTVAAALAVEGVGAECVTALVMPAALSDGTAARQAEAVADVLGVAYRRLPLHPLVGAFQEVVGESGQPGDDLVATRRAVSRLRMTCAYYVADAADALVVGATNRTRRLLGPLVAHGDTGVDCALLGDLYRTEVDALATYLDVPEELGDRSDACLAGDADPPADRLDCSPRTVDRILRLSVDEREGPTAVAEELGVDPDAVARVRRWCGATRRKRHQPPKPSTYI